MEQYAILLQILQIRISKVVFGHRECILGKIFEIFEKLTSDLAHLVNKISKKRKKLSCSNPLEIYTNRREISRWFQKCITSYAYFAYLLRYVHFTVEKCRFRCRASKSTFFDSKMKIFRKLRKISIWSYTFLKSAWNFASIGVYFKGIWATSFFSFLRDFIYQMREVWSQFFENFKNFAQNAFSMTKHNFWNANLQYLKKMCILFQPYL